MTPPAGRPRRGARAVVLSVVSGLAVVMVPVALSIAVSIALSIAAAPAAWAHSTLISSSPAADSMLATAPTRIELVFNEQIRDFQPKIAITVGDHDPIEVTPVVDGPTVTADLTGVTWPTDGGTGSGTASGTAGGTVGAVAWKVGYRVVSADGHPVSGLVPFSVGSGPATASGAATASGGITSGAATASGAAPSGAASGGAPGGTVATVTSGATGGDPAAASPAGPVADGGSSGLVWIGGAVAIGGALVVGAVLFSRRPRPGGPPAGGPDR